MIVALGAAQGGSKPDGRGCPYAVGRILRQVFLVLRSALCGHHIEPVVPGGDPQREILISSRKKIPRELLQGKTVKGLVGIERGDNVIAKRRHADRIVTVDPTGVGVPDQVQPVDRHPLTIAWRLKEPVDQGGKGLVAGIRAEPLNLGWRRGQPQQVEIQPPDQIPGVRPPCGLHPLRHQPRMDKTINRMVPAGAGE